MYRLKRLTAFREKITRGVLAFVSPVALQRIEDIIPAIYEAGETPFVLVLDQVTDVRNFGAIVRSAECAGGPMPLLFPDKGSARINARRCENFRRSIAPNSGLPYPQPERNRFRS